MIDLQIECKPVKHPRITLTRTRFVLKYNNEDPTIDEFDLNELVIKAKYLYDKYLKSNIQISIRGRLIRKLSGCSYSFTPDSESEKHYVPIKRVIEEEHFI